MVAPDTDDQVVGGARRGIRQENSQGKKKGSKPAQPSPLMSGSDQLKELVLINAQSLPDPEGKKSNGDSEVNKKIHSLKDPSSAQVLAKD